MRTRWQRRIASLFSVYPYVDLENSGRDRRLWRGPFDTFDAFSLGFAAVIALVLLARADGLQPWMSDTWYHLAIADQVVDQRGIPAWVDWDYAPVGRPHLYPPLLHVLLALLSLVTGSVISAGQVLAVLFLPASYIACWYAARWIFDSRTALVAVLVLSLDFGNTLVELAYIPSCFVNILAPLLLVTLLTRRTWASIALLTLMLYAHLGIPYLAAFGLVLFGIKYPRYRSEVIKVVGIALLFALPWLLRVWLHREWIAGVTSNVGLPMGLWKRIFSLQLFNGVLIGCGLWGIRNLHKGRAQEAIVRWLLVGMLPLLFSYGGRYTMHSAPLWAIPAATVLVRLLPAGATWKRAAGLAAATLLPTPSLVPLTTTHAMVLLAAKGRPLFGDNPRKSEAYLADCDQVTAWLRAHTTPHEIIHVNKEWIGDMIPLLAGRPTDFGAWWECSREVAKLHNRHFRDDGRRSVFVCVHPQSDPGSILGPTRTMPFVDERTAFGRLVVGVRHERRFSARQTLDAFDDAKGLKWRANDAGPNCRLAVASEPNAPASDHAAADVSPQEGPDTGPSPFASEVPGPGAQPKPPGSAQTLDRQERRFLSWRISRHVGDAPRIERPFAPGKATGVALNIRTSAPLGDVTLGVTETDGSEYEWSLALPSLSHAIGLGPADEQPSREVSRRARWLRVRVPFDWMARCEDSEDENGELDIDRIDRLWLRGPKERKREVQIDIDDVTLMNVSIHRPERDRDGVADR